MRNALNSANHEGHEDHEGKSKSSFAQRIFSTENLWAFILFLVIVALVVFTSDSSPVWIYQGF